MIREGAEGVGDERAALVALPAGVLAIISDGAGGMAGGAAAAELLVHEIRAALGEHRELPDGDAISAALVRADGVIAAARLAGQTAALVAVVGADRVGGATVGRCQALLLREQEVRTLSTAGRQPLLGTGAAQPRPFEGAMVGARLLLGNDFGHADFAGNAMSVTLEVLLFPSPCRLLSTGTV